MATSDSQKNKAASTSNKPVKQKTSNYASYAYDVCSKSHVEFFTDDVSNIENATEQSTSTTASESRKESGQQYVFCERTIPPPKNAILSWEPYFGCGCQNGNNRKKWLISCCVPCLVLREIDKKAKILENRQKNDGIFGCFLCLWHCLPFYTYLHLSLSLIFPTATFLGVVTTTEAHRGTILLILLLLPLWMLIATMSAGMIFHKFFISKLEDEKLLHILRRNHPCDTVLAYGICYPCFLLSIDNTVQNAVKEGKLEKGSGGSWFNVEVVGAPVKGNSSRKDSGLASISPTSPTFK